MLIGMVKLRKIVFLVSFLVLILASSVMHSVHSSSTWIYNSDQSAPPLGYSIDTSSMFTSRGETGCGVVVGVGENWMTNLNIYQGNGSEGSTGEGLYSNIQFYVNNDSYMCFETELACQPDGSSGYMNNNYSPPSLYLNFSGTIIPINLWNSTSFNESITPITTTADGLSAFNNTFTFHDIALDTYGNAPSNVTLTLTQQIIANYSLVTEKMGTTLDLTNSHLYYPNGTEVSAGANFSLTILYTTNMSNLTESWQVGHACNLQPSVTPTEIYYTSNNGYGYQYNMADMNFGDPYTEYQGTTQIANKTATAYFAPMLSGVQGTAANFVLCYQTFDNLTYGLTTKIASDPTVETSFTGSANSSMPSVLGIPITVIVVVVAAAAASVGASIIFLRRRHSNLKNKTSSS